MIVIARKGRNRIPLIGLLHFFSGVTHRVRACLNTTTECVG
jgi:hypothetical protein